MNLILLFLKFHLGFPASQAWATLAAMTGNFFLNNQITYRDRRLHGGYMMLGLLSFFLACSFGAWANVSLAENLLDSGAPWYISGLAGMVLSAVWNYSVSNLFTWQMPHPRAVSPPAILKSALPSAKPTAPPPAW